MTAVKGKGRRVSGKRSLPLKPKPELFYIYTITSSRKCIPALIPLMEELIQLIEINIVSADITIQPLQYHDLFSILDMVHGLFMDIFIGKITSPVDRGSIDEVMKFLMLGSGVFGPKFQGLRDLVGKGLELNKYYSMCSF